MVKYPSKCHTSPSFVAQHPKVNRAYDRRLINICVHYIYFFSDSSQITFEGMSPICVILVRFVVLSISFGFILGKNFLVIYETN